MDAALRTRTMRLMLRPLLLLLLFPAAVLLRADEVGHEVARQHAERGEGKYREIRSLYTEGRMLLGREVIEVRMWAERPNRLRVESGTEGRKATQVYDGQHEPVMTHTDFEAGKPLRMSAGERTDFIANADFDGPLVDFALKGYAVDFAGEESVDDRPAKKLLLMNQAGEVSFLWVDNATAEIVKRAVFRVSGEKRVLVETYFGDFRDVGGVRMPHRIETKVGERSIYLMLLSRMEVNTGKVTAEQFAVPADWPLLPVEFKSQAAPAAH